MSGIQRPGLYMAVSYATSMLKKVKHVSFPCYDLTPYQGLDVNKILTEFAKKEQSIKKKV